VTAAATEPTGRAGSDGAALVLTSVDKAFPTPAGPRPVLSGLDLTVDAGEVVAVAGRSGSGKTTLLTIVAGWERPDAGRVVVLGDEVDGDDGSPPGLSWSDVAILPQSLGLLDELTLAENVTLPLRLDGASDSADPDELMVRLGVDHLADRFPSQVSLGERQRAALARAAVGRPRLLLADEPIAHQNAGWAEGMMLIVAELSERGTTCLLATHNEIAFGGADRVLELRDGRLVPASRSSERYI
jgi:putative ABC transport system ATP-binding protein